jgi:hypothetical protein
MLSPSSVDRCLKYRCAVLQGDILRFCLTRFNHSNGLSLEVVKDSPP